MAEVAHKTSRGRADSRLGVASTMDVDDDRDGAVRRGMTCPITREHFVDPVFCVGDGHTFERSAIESWFERNDTSPMTGATLTCKALVPNFQARRLADETRPAPLSHEARARQNHLPELRLDASDWRSLVVTVDDVPLPVDRRPEPPAAFVVAGAGRVDVNGAFVRDGVFQGAHAYRRGAFRLTRRRLADGRDWWIVSGASRRPEGAANDPLDDAFYLVRSSACLPPARGWENGRNGVLPPPVVAAGDAPEADEEKNDAATGNRTRDVAVREDEDDPPESYTVSGAGIRRVNGEYVRDGTFQGAHLYKKGRLWLVRFRMTSHPGQADVWFVADSRRLTSDRGDFYRARCGARLPPTEGWDLAWDGREPAPKLTPNARRTRARGMWGAMCMAANADAGE